MSDSSRTHATAPVDGLCQTCDCDYWHSEHRWHCATNYHHPDCYQSTGVPADLPAGLCDCRVLRMLDEEAGR